MSEEGQDVLVLASHDINESSESVASCGETATSIALNKLLTGSNSSGTSSSSTYILYIPGFRKIEPKPGLELRSNEVIEEKEATLKETKPVLSGRFLGINATKRGVKTCPTCLNKIGYRAKQCKHCSPSKTRNPKRLRLQNIKPLISKQNESTETEMVGMATRQHDPVTMTTDQGSRQKLEESKVTHDEACLTSGEEQTGLRGTTIVPQPEHLVTSGNEHVSGLPMMSQGELVVSEDQQASESLTPQDNQQGLEGILQQRQSQDESLDKPQDTQYEHVGQITDQEQQSQVVDEVVVSNVTEISTSGGDRMDKINEEVVVTSENQEMVNQVFISSKLTRSNPSAIPSERFSLQDLICGLLAQNQAGIAGVSPEESKENPISSSETTAIAVQTDSSKPKERGTCSVDLENNQEKKNIQENSFDANSVALFLGEMAQRNGKKRRISSISKSTDETKLVTITPGSIALQKWNILTGSDTKGAKFRKIQPKDIANVQEEIAMCEEEKEETGELRGESQCRIMNGNATRRGVMLCTKCNKMIGCRSKICKHCKTQVTENPPRETNPRVIKQAVQLCLPKELDIQMFSVRKCKTGPELRCFVQFEDKHNKTTNKTKTCSSKYTCDYPLCITAKELGKASDYVCEHAKICCVSGNVIKAKIPKLNAEKLSEMPFGNDLKDMVQVLHQQCSASNIPLVQHVSCKTLVVVDQLRSDANHPLGTDIVNFAHVRFEKVRGQGCFQRQVFCSGQSCMGWNFISNDSPASLMKSCSCVHYAVALWAIASDNSLLKDLREYLDAFVLQSRIETIKT